MLNVPNNITNPSFTGNNMSHSARIRSFSHEEGVGNFNHLNPQGIESLSQVFQSI